ncbi:MAG: LacI family transcriptional regulator [Methylacidiphilales bacterium]|nr:LacI family transcriptional regulator [Candidatus Methylacidiphilales bacterium]
MMQPRVTLRDIAAKAGVHHTTVSRALKDDPRVCAETLAKIRALAKRMGYMPDPMLSSLNAYRHASRGHQYHGTVAWISNFSTREGWRGSDCYKLYFQGASDQLMRHGYRLEEFWLREPGMTARSSSQVLFSRGIRGLLICPLAISRGHLSLQWERFSAVTFGYSLVRPKLHLFSAAHYRAMITAMRKLRVMGYRRIGMVTAYNMNERMDRMWTAAYSAALPVLPGSQTIPILQLGERARSARASDKKDHLHVLKWFRAHKPEAIISPTTPVAEWLIEAGYRLPKDVAVVNTSLHKEAFVSGIVEDSREIGRAAADFLVGMLQRGEYGVPSTPQRVLLEGKWYGGKTTAPQDQALLVN